VRLWTLYRFPFDIAASVSYFYGSGNRFAANINTAVYGKAGTNRLNLTAAGGAAATINLPTTTNLTAGVDANGNPIVIATIPTADRFDDVSSIPSGYTIARNALEGLPLHKVDLRVTK